MKNEEKKAESGNEIPTLSSFFLSDVRSMSPEGWSRLVNTFGPIVYRWCRASGVSHNDAPDVVQDVFTTVARGIAKFERQKESGSFRSWLATITRSRVRDFFRLQSRRGQAPGGTDAWQRLQREPDLLDSTVTVAGMRNQLLHRVTESVKSEFEETTWQAFWMTAVEEKSAALVADHLGINVASVYQAKSRVLRKLRQRMAELPP